MKVRTRMAVLASALAATLAPGGVALAQDAGDGFLFQRPTGSFSLHGGFAAPSARSDIFSFTTSQLTVNRGDFSAVDFGADLAFSVAPRFDLVLDLSYSGMSKGSEFRNYVDNNNQPIQQTTSFQRTPLTLSARYYLLPQGRQIGHFAWVPRRIVPYVGAGVGMMYYEFEQKGDFVDDSTLAVFNDTFHSGGWAPVAQGLAGIEWSLGPKWALTTEVHYLTGSAAMSSDFEGFHRIDLSGVTSSVGFFVRF
jgi:outer membrane protein W